MREPAELTDHLGYWLRVVSNSVSQAFAARLEARGVTVAEWVVLRMLYGREPTAPSRLAAEMGMTKGAITRLADRLIAKDFLARTANREDGRAQTLRLTEAGARLVPALAADADANEAEAFAALTEEERQALRALLMRLVATRGLSAPAVD